MHIPTRLNERLQKDQAYHGAVLSSIANLEGWLRPDQPFFFPYYTIHGIRHITDVLTAASSLIRDEAWEIITPGDVAVLTIGTLLHDAAMYLTPDGLVDLVQASDKYQSVAGFNDVPWDKLWDDYIAEARRFDGRTLQEKFGVTEPIQKPGADLIQWAEANRRVVGEFLRRHHPRLAHEIALYGVPGPHEDRLRLQGIDPDIADIAGLVARSHGLPLRPCADYLAHKYHNKRDYKRIHAVFLMALLRVADYLQIQSERAPHQFLQVNEIRVPVSVGEWNAHKSVRDINTSHDDPEAIFVDTQPPDVKTYLRIKDWLSGIQAELDHCWSVLGEVYGPKPQLCNLGLVLRRVRSILDDEAGFGKIVNYIPVHASLQTEEAEIINLLIGPLYNNRPEFGIRELLQNALDAVHELRIYREKYPAARNIKLKAQKADVVISIDDDQDNSHWLTVSDRGIGMTIDTIRNYFLKAGASFRKSDAWRREFEDEKGRSYALRSGRFGVGVLAAFLLGDEVRVTTRYITDAEGIAFLVKLDSDAVELQRINRPVGTTIRVQITDEVKSELSDFDENWDWYCCSSPSVIRMMQPESKRLKQHVKFPEIDSHLPSGWHRISHEEFQDIQWTYIADPLLACNGIKIKDPWHTPWLGWDEDPAFDSTPFRRPCLSVFDADGKLPLNLQRSLSRIDLPFFESLIEDIYKDFVAFSLNFAPDRPLGMLQPHDIISSYYPGLHRRPWCPWFSSQNGVSFVSRWNISQQNISRALIVLVLHGCGKIEDYLVSHPCAVFAVVTPPTPMLADQDSLPGLYMESHLGTQFPLFSMKANGKRLLIPREILKGTYRDVNKQKYTMWKGDKCKWRKSELKVEVEWENKDLVLLRMGVCGPSSIDFNALAKSIDGTDIAGWPVPLAEWYFADNNYAMTEWDKMWDKFIGHDPLPFSKQERRDRFAGLYKELASYIAAQSVLFPKQKL
jgi:hypothetical protein